MGGLSFVKTYANAASSYDQNVVVKLINAAQTSR